MDFPTCQSAGIRTIFGNGRDITSGCIVGALVCLKEIFVRV